MVAEYSKIYNIVKKIRRKNVSMSNVKYNNIAENVWFSALKAQSYTNSKNKTKVVFDEYY